MAVLEPARMDIFEERPQTVKAVTMTLDNLKKIIYNLPSDFEVGYSAKEQTIRISGKSVDGDFEVDIVGGRHDVLVLHPNGDMFTMTVDHFESLYRFVESR